MLYFPSVSVIIPIYNAESHLKICINSILNQSFCDYEIILINDGSEDSSGEICDDLVIVDSRIRAFHQNNGGVVNARRSGILKSHGEWIVFVDADDTLLPNALKNLMQYSSNSEYDIVKASFVGWPDGNIWNHSLNGGIVMNDYIYGLIKGTVYGVVYASAYKREIFSNDLFLIDSTLKIGEDVLMNIELARRVNKVFVSNDVVYQYNNVEGSAMNKYLLHPTYHIRFFEVLRCLVEKIEGIEHQRIIELINEREVKVLLRAVFIPGISLSNNEWNKILSIVNLKSSTLGFNFREYFHLMLTRSIFICKLAKSFYSFLYFLKDTLFQKKSNVHRIVLK